jgi:hypothetical protein
LFNVDFALDYSLPYENQSWRVKYKRKAEILNAIQSSNITLNNIIANHEPHMQNSLLGEISMFEDNIIASTAVNAGKNYSAKVLGCHAKNMYTEEVSKQLGKSWCSKAIGNHLLSFDVTSPLLYIQWNVLKVTKIPPNMSDIKFSENKFTWDDRQFKQVIFNADPAYTNLLAVDQRTRSVVLFDWLKMEKTEVDQSLGTPLALHKNTIVTVLQRAAHQATVFLYQDLKLEQQFEVYGQNDVYCAALNDHVLVFATISIIYVCNRRTNRVEYTFKRQRSFPLFLFEDLLVFNNQMGVTFYDLNSRKDLAQVKFYGTVIKKVIKHSPTEFVMQTDDTVLLLRWETKAKQITLMQVTQAGELKEITISSPELHGTAQAALKAAVGDVYSSFVFKKPSSGKRYIMLFNGKPDKKAKPNVKANELLKEYFRVTSSYVYMPYCPYVVNGAFPSDNKPVLDRDVVVKGDVIIYCEQLVNGKMQLCKPEKWPTELYTKTIGHENNNNNNNQNGKSSAKTKRKNK